MKLAVLAVLLAAVPVFAHDARPLSIQIAGQQKNAYRVDVLMPSSIEADNQPEIRFPQGCTAHSGARRETTDAFVKTMLVGCGSSASAIDGQKIVIHYPLYNPSLSTLLRYTPTEGGTRTAVLPPDQTEWIVPQAPNWKTVARDYLVLGVKHIWEGVDHLLFIVGLLLLARTPRRIAIAVTGFTLAHSVTLSLSALGFVQLPLPPIEAGIALSILFLAREVALRQPDSLARRFPLAVSSAFGLLHGFGFAAALRDAGLPRQEIAAALLFFNAGVEVGQLAFIAVVLGLTALVLGKSQRAMSWVEAGSAYALGIPAAFWFVERVRVFWG